METITDHIIRIHDRIKRAVPEFSGIHFATKDDGEMFGYIHIQSGARSFNSIQELKAIVQTYKPYEQPETYHCVSNEHIYTYRIDPEDGSINLGQPDEQALATIKADCRADYNYRMEKKAENYGENLGLEMEQRRVG